MGRLPLMSILRASEDRAKSRPQLLVTKAF